MQRDLFEQDHDDFRQVVAGFVQRHVADHVMEWEDAKQIDRAVWLEAGRAGLIGLHVPTAQGGAGLTDYRFRTVVLEELAKVYAMSLSSGFSLQDDIATPYLASLGTEAQKQRWLPGMCTGELIGAIAMTEPSTGSDLRGIRTTAQRVDGGWRLAGAKTFITNGITSDLVITVARTSGADDRPAFSLLVVERDMDGFSRGRKLRKMGLHAQDTAELFFDDVFVPDDNLLGEQDAAMTYLSSNLPLERLSIAVQAIAVSQVVLRDTIEYVSGRTAFGRRIADFQNSRFVLAQASTELEMARAYVDRCILAHSTGDLSPVEAARAKLGATEMQHRLIDQCLQLFGGYGFMNEYPVSRAYQDARIQRIYGGTNEIMKELIARDLVGRA